MALRTLLRRWLGITGIEARVVLLQNTVDGISVMSTDLATKHTKLNEARQEVRELKEMLAMDKTVPIRARNSQQYRQLMEQD